MNISASSTTRAILMVGFLALAACEAGPTFQKWIAPELEYHAAPTRAHTLAAVMLLPIRGNTTWVSVRRWKTFPTVLPGPFTPAGERIITAVSMGLLFGQ